MDSYNNETFFSNIKNVINYFIENHHKLLLLLFVFVIIYGVDYISYINTLLYNTTSSVPSLNATTPPLQNFKKTKGKSIRKRKQ
jgi:hypothetical protein